MSEKFDRGGLMPQAEGVDNMLVREDGMVSFDGARGPWMRILTPAEIKELTNPYRSQA